MCWWVEKRKWKHWYSKWDLSKSVPYLSYVVPPSTWALLVKTALNLRYYKEELMRLFYILPHTNRYCKVYKHVCQTCAEAIFEKSFSSHRSFICSCSAWKHELVLKPESSKLLSAQVNANWAEEPGTWRRSCSGAVDENRSTVVCYCTSPQKCHTVSSKQAESIAIFESGKVGLWPWQTFNEVRFHQYFTAII